MKKIILVLMVLVSSLCFGKYEKNYNIKKVELTKREGVQYKLDDYNFFESMKGDHFDYVEESFVKSGLKIGARSVKGGKIKILIVSNEDGTFGKMCIYNLNKTIIVATNRDSRFMSYMKLNDLMGADIFTMFADTIVHRIGSYTIEY